MICFFICWPSVREGMRQAKELAAVPQWLSATRRAQPFCNVTMI
jgi:hypothetical protein